MDIIFDALPTADWIDIASIIALAVHTAVFIILLIRYLGASDPIDKRAFRNAALFPLGLACLLIFAMAAGYFSYQVYDDGSYRFMWYFYLVGIGSVVLVPLTLLGANDELRNQIQSELNSEAAAKSIKDGGTAQAGTDQFAISLRAPGRMSNQWDPAVLTVNYDTRDILIEKQGAEPVYLNSSNINKVKFDNHHHIAKVKTDNGVSHLNFGIGGLSFLRYSRATAEEELNYKRFKQLWKATAAVQKV